MAVYETQHYSLTASGAYSKASRAIFTADDLAAIVRRSNGYAA